MSRLWCASGARYHQTRQPGKDNSLTGANLDRPNVVPGAQMYTDAPHGLKYQYLNPSLYTANALGTFGNAGHNLSLIHISEPTRLGMISYAVFCLKKKKKKK